MRDRYLPLLPHSKDFSCSLQLDKSVITGIATGNESLHNKSLIRMWCEAPAPQVRIVPKERKDRRGRDVRENGRYHSEDVPNPCSIRMPPLRRFFSD